MSTVKVTYDTDEDRVWTPSLETVREGVLTTEHAASSYGVPVLVAQDGTVMGAAEAPPLQVARQSPWPEYERDGRDEDHDRAITAEHRAIIASAIAAGYQVSLVEGK